MKHRLTILGFAIWLAASLALRFTGQFWLRQGSPVRTVLLYAISFGAVAWLTRRLCRRLALPREEWPAGAISLLLATLLLDPFSSAFFSSIFPNLDPSAAGLFGGWMLICCAGGLTGAIVRR